MSYGKMNYFCFPQFAAHTLSQTDNIVPATIQAADQQDALVYFIASCVPLTLIAKQVDVPLLRRINANAGKRFVQRFRREPAMLPRPSTTIGSPRRAFANEDESLIFVVHCRLI